MARKDGGALLQQLPWSPCHLGQLSSRPFSPLSAVPTLPASKRSFVKYAIGNKVQKIMFKNPVVWIRNDLCECESSCEFLEFPIRILRMVFRHILKYKKNPYYQSKIKIFQPAAIFYCTLQPYSPESTGQILDLKF